METSRKIIAAIVGIVVIILLVLLARWLGDRIRERFVSQRPDTSNIEVIPPEDEVVDDTRFATLSGRNATLSAIPSTGPNEFASAIIIFFFIVGASTLAISKRWTSS